MTDPFSSPNPDPVPNVLTGHQRLQVVSAHVVRRSLIDLLRHSLQEAHWNISDRQRWRGEGKYNLINSFKYNYLSCIHRSATTLPLLYLLFFIPFKHILKAMSPAGSNTDEMTLWLTVGQWIWLIHSNWNTIHGNVCWCQPAHEGEPLQHEVAGLLYTSGVGAPVLQTKVGEIPEDVQAFTGRDVPVSALLYFGEDPGLDESTSEEKPTTKTSIILHCILPSNLSPLC